MGKLSQFDSTVRVIDLINIALSYLNQPEISSFEEKSTAASLMKLHWPLSVRYLLGRYDWSFALNRAAGQRVSSEETEEENALYPGYPYCFSFPAGLVRLTRLYDKNGNPLISTSDMVRRIIGSAPATKQKYKICGNKIRTPEPEIIIEFVEYTENINVFPSSFMVCLTYDLAMRGAKTLVNSAGYEQQMRQNLLSELQVAMNRDSGQLPGSAAY